MTLIEKHMENLRQKDTTALEQIYLHSKNAVFSIIYSITRNYQSAEDLMQETYIKVFNNINQYKAGTNALSWIYTIAKNLALNSYNRQKHEVSTDFNEMSNMLAGGELILKDESGIFKIMSKTLDSNEYNIVLMHTIGGLKLKEIAELFKKPQGTIRWQYNNALKKMKIKLKNKEDSIL